MVFRQARAAPKASPGEGQGTDGRFGLAEGFTEFNEEVVILLVDLVGPGLSATASAPRGQGQP